MEKEELINYALILGGVSVCCYGIYRQHQTAEKEENQPPDNVIEVDFVDNG